jgi:adenylate cyclase
VDPNGYFYVNWEIATTNPNLTVEPFENLLQQDQLRSNGATNDLVNRWQNKLAVIGSKATGNDLTDRGATPLEKSALLVGKHWNVANSIITGRFIRPASLSQELALIVLLGVLTALLSWQLRVLPGLLGVSVLAIVYTALCVYLFNAYRLWLPLILPLVGALFVQYGLLVTYRAIFEQREQRRVKAVFSRIVAPEVVNELLEAETLALGGARREVTVMFADVRGFTEITDRLQESTADQIRQLQLTGRDAEARYDEVAAQMLQTISLYLGLIADIVKKHGGTLDKYIGDCAMAFWGAPKMNPEHALGCVRAAIEAQRGIHALNERRQAENAALATENQARVAAGLPPKPLLPVLTLGTGINSGAVMVGLMGSDAHGLNYTVIGREVNLASRLETVSGRGRIIIGETTYEQIRHADPALAATCIEQEPTTPKGFLKPVRNFEVPWRNSHPSASS